MSQSNLKILRKKVAAKLEDEIFTINTDIEELTKKLTTVDYKTLHKLSYDKLKSIREDLSWIIPRLNNINNRLNNISHDYGHVIDLTEENLPKVIVSTSTMNRLEKEIKKQNPEIEGRIIDITEPEQKLLGNDIKRIEE